VSTLILGYPLLEIRNNTYFFIKYLIIFGQATYKEKYVGGKIL